MFDLAQRTSDYVVFGDNADVLPKLPDAVVPAHLHRPTLQHREGPATAHARSPAGRRTATVGDSGVAATHVETGRKSYGDEFDDYLGFLGPRLGRRAAAAP